MKRQFVALALGLTTLGVSAQVSEYSNGHVGIARNTGSSTALLSVGNRANLSSSYSLHTYSYNNVMTSGFNIGVDGWAYQENAYSSGRSYGTRGMAGNFTSGYNYGVLGGLMGNNYGAGVYGTTSNIVGTYVPGRYAGYFVGEVYATEKITAKEVYIPSDERLKTNIVSLANDNTVSALDDVLGMNVIKYNLKTISYPEVGDTVSAEKLNVVSDNNNTKKYIGLSAQELQKIYPELVSEGQDGYLAVNYIELVPILIRSIQELHQEVESLRTGIEYSSMNAKTTSMTNNIVGNTALYQNVPNPFKEKTVIKFSLPSDVSDNAYICIFNMQGVLMKQIPVNNKMNSVTIDGDELVSGMYIYSLIVNNKEFATKRMIITQ